MLTLGRRRALARCLLVLCILLSPSVRAADTRHSRPRRRAPVRISRGERAVGAEAHQILAQRAGARQGASADSPYASKTVQLSFSGGTASGKTCSAGCADGGTFENVTWACSGGPKANQGNWDGGALTFKDPLPGPPMSYVVVNVSVEIVGRFNCLSRTEGDLLIVSVQASEINVVRMPAKPANCDCPQCVSSFTLAAMDPGPIDGYVYGGSNSVLINPAETVDQNYVCIASISLTLFYAPAKPTIYDLLPPAGPTSGATNVTVWGEDFDELVALECIWGSNNSSQPATFVSQYFVTCPTAPAKTSGESELFMRVKATGKTYDSGQSFTYYVSPNVTSLDPAKGPAKGKNDVVIHGSGFVDLKTSTVVCDFGAGKVVGAYISETSVKCINIPPGEGRAVVRFSQNGQQFSRPLYYTYEVSASSKSSPAPLIPGWVVISGFFAICTALSLIAVVVTKRWRQRAAEKRAFESGTYSESEGLMSPSRPSFDITKQIDISDVNIRERIGKGTFGEVYSGTWRGTDVAVKFLTAGFGNDEIQDQEFLAEFDREVTIMRCCRHPNVLQFLGACAAPPNVCIVMEFMPRGSLFGLLHDPKFESRITLRRLKHMLVDAAKGMNYLHNSNPVIIHRDLKSHNLLVDENFKVKVCDFGLSKILETQADVASLTACGTPSWTAPEILRNEQYSEAADVYSFGVVLWECVTRLDPYEGMPPFQVVLAVGTKGMRPPLNDGDYPEDWSELIRQCWAEDPDSRPIFDEIIERLLVLGGGGSERRPRRRHPVSSSSETDHTDSGAQSYGTHSYGTQSYGAQSSMSPPLQQTPRILFKEEEQKGVDFL